MREEKVLFEATLCFPVKGDKVLLARKTKKIGAGMWNGYGGGIEAGETPEVCAVREFREESGLEICEADLEKVAVVDFHNTKSDGTTFVCKVHVYLCEIGEQAATPTEEMVTPTWFDKSNLPLDEMMPADRVWVPVVMSGKKIEATAHLGPFQQTLLGEVEIREI